MEITKSVLSIAFSLMVSVTGLSQSASPSQTTSGSKSASESSEKKALEKKALALVDEILKEAATLKLAENRIRLQASAADVLWKHNEKRARELFKLAMASLSDIKAGSDDDQLSGWTRGNGDSRLTQSRSQLRQEILQLVARHDGKLAREMLRSTSDSSTGKPGDNNERDLDTELGLAAGIAATDPALALQIAEESLEKGLPHQLISIMVQLEARDKAAAAKLIAAVMKKLRSANLSTDSTAAGFATVFLQMAIDPDDEDEDEDDEPVVKGPTAGSTIQVLDEKTLRELIDMVVTAALATPRVSSRSIEDGDHGGSYLLVALRSLMPQIEKYSPAGALALNKKFAEFTRNLSPDARAVMEGVALAERGDVEGLAQAAANTPEEIRQELWGQAAMKALGEGDVERARQIVVEHFEEGPHRDSMMAQIDVQALQRATEAGKLEDARQLFGGVPIADRVGVLTQLALRASAKNDKKLALQLLDEARGMLGARAINATELSAFLLIARVYGTIDPLRSFDMIEPIVDQLNVLLAAAAVLDGFEHTRYFKDGELLPATGQSLLVSVVMQCENDLGQLARADFDRSKATADRFQAYEVRVMARMAVAQGVLSDNLPGPNVSLPISGRYYGGQIFSR